jgi:hypothetical protein
MEKLVLEDNSASLPMIYRLVSIAKALARTRNSSLHDSMIHENNFSVLHEQTSAMQMWCAVRGMSVI